ncbi:zinc dependent phospholipase C family protein [Clostridium oryzae]|uniref:zinc dependent phospholipase C family protein n=1 Tax=Clostridium oryzae TaxID=1450648 RepID=UPI0009A49C83
MRNRLENTYGKTMQGLMFAVNPLKKMVLKTHCTVHKYINIRAIEILANEGYLDVYKFYRDNIVQLNLGVTWADQDFKSTNHFYHYKKNKGLYGFSDAYTECRRYYDKAKCLYIKNDIEKSIFYFGASCHLVQDVTVPQHVNNRLLNSHRDFEVWIISKLLSDYSFRIDRGIKRYDTIKQYFDGSSSLANETYMKFSKIEDRDKKYKEIAQIILKEAQITTAGFMLDFYEHIVIKR